MNKTMLKCERCAYKYSGTDNRGWCRYFTLIPSRCLIPLLRKESNPSDHRADQETSHGK